MNILFLTYNFYPDFDTNSFIVNNLSRAFIDQGHEMHVLTLKSYPESREVEVWNNIYIHRIRQSYNKKQISNYLAKVKLLPAFKLTTSILRNKYRKKEYIHSYWSYYSTERMKYIIDMYDINLVVNVCYPFESCLPILKYLKRNKKNFKWIVYMQDPFATQYYYIHKYANMDLQTFQSNVFHLADKIIVTDAIAKEIQASDNPMLMHKTHILNFPIITRLQRTMRDELHFNHRYINCVYVGKFNQETRNPCLLFQLFEALKRDYIRLHIIGEDKDKWIDYLSDTESNIFFYGTKSKEACINAELDANILVNLGNSVSNQLPSKILEYISTGKPIVNLYKAVNCPTLAYTSKYPLCINLMEQMNQEELILRDLRYFCKRYRNANISYNMIKRIYMDCTVEYVSMQFLYICNELIN